MRTLSAPRVGLWRRGCVEPNLQPGYPMISSRTPSKLKGARIQIPNPEFNYQPEVVTILRGEVQNRGRLVVDLQTQNPRNAPR